jgi:diguanylate cyclase (GGDEF)-like protein
MARQADSSADVGKGIPAAFSRAPEPYILVLAIVALLLAVIWGTTFHVLRVEQDGAQQKARQSSADLLETYEAQMVRNLATIDQTLRTLQYAFRINGRYALLDELDEHRLLPPTLLFEVSIIDSQGKVVASTRTAAAETLAERTVLLVHAHGDSDTTLITGPRQAGGKGEWRMLFSRGLRTRDGSFAGAVSVSVEPAYFTSGYDGARLGSNGVLALLDADGRFLVKRSGDRVSWGEHAGLGVEEMNAGAATLNAWDRVTRYTHVRALHGFPLAVVVGLSESEQLASFEQARRDYLLKAGGATVLLLVVAGVMGALAWQLTRSRRHMRKVQETYYAASNASLDACFVLRSMRDADGRIVDFVVEDTNSRGAALFGATPQQLYERTLCSAFPEARHNGVLEEFASVANNMLVEETEWKNTHPRMRGDWLQRQLVPVQGGLMLIVRDISERKREESLRLQQGRVLESIAKGTPLHKVLHELLLLIASQRPDVICSILLLDDAGRLTHGAALGLEQAYTDAINGLMIGPKVGSCGTAAYRRESVMVCDIQTDPLWEDYRELAAAYGLRSCWSTPILSHGSRVLGTFALYDRQSRQPTALEWQMVEIASRIGAIAIERQQTEDRIRHMAYHDPLTGLPNRSLLEDRGRQAILHAQRNERRMTVVLIDLDNFKVINDTLGHNTGDELLKTVAQRMLQSVRSTDTVIRLGGDEFVIVLSDQAHDWSALMLPLQKIHEAIAQPVVLAGREVQATCSMGIASYPTDGADLQSLLMNADTAMYRAKELGRNNFQFYTPDMHREMQEKLTLQEGLRNALARQEVFLVYQPQIELRSGRVIGVEALIRWRHPTLGMVSPARFIPLAEESGLIVPLGDWVLRTACRQNKAWQDAGLSRCTVSVNVSAKQFKEGGLIARVDAALTASGLEPQYLGLELTESLLMQDQDKAVAVMHELRAAGVQLSIDDFGTGYSSLSALKSFPIGHLKLDRSFVKDLPHDEDDKAITKAVISLGHQLGMKIVAEGVETAQQLAFLRENGCEEIQGYYFSKPLSAEEMAAFLARPVFEGAALKV